MMAGLDIGRNVDAEYVSASSRQTIGQNETNGLGIVGSTVVGWKTLEMLQAGKAAEEATTQTGIKEAARSDRAATEAAKAVDLKALDVDLAEIVQ